MKRSAVVGAVEKFRRDGWAPPWPVGVECCATCFLTKPTIAGSMHARASARIPVAEQGDVRIWNWEKLWKDAVVWRPGCDS